MPRRSKREAELRMSIGLARVMMLEGKEPREALEAIKTQLDNRDELECLQPQQTKGADEAVRIRKTT